MVFWYNNCVYRNTCIMVKMQCIGVNASNPEFALINITMHIIAGAQPNTYNTATNHVISLILIGINHLNYQ